eukprot:Nk52_evm12s2604 gene=Nk52_evmTU12s2604
MSFKFNLLGLLVPVAITIFIYFVYFQEKGYHPKWRTECMIPTCDKVADPSGDAEHFKTITNPLEKNITEIQTGVWRQVVGNLRGWKEDKEAEMLCPMYRRWFCYNIQADLIYKEKFGSWLYGGSCWPKFKQHVPKGVTAPGHKAPSPGFKGVIMGMHGFSACPLQFEQLCENAAARGFDCLVPTLPGEGAVFQHTLYPVLPGMSNGMNMSRYSWGLNIQHVPEEWTTYRDWSNTMNHIMEALPSEVDTVITGLSIGATVASYMAQTVRVLEDGTKIALYNRSLIMNPMVKMSGVPYLQIPLKILGFENLAYAFNDAIVDTIGWMIQTTLHWTSFLFPQNALREFLMGWGPFTPCAYALNTYIPYSFCMFSVSHLWASIDFGSRILDYTRPLPPGHKWQMVLDDHDGSVNQHTNWEMYKRLGNSDKSLCLIPTGYGHAFFSIDPARGGAGQGSWMNEMLCKVVSYLVQDDKIVYGDAEDERKFALDEEGFWPKMAVENIAPSMWPHPTLDWRYANHYYDIALPCYTRCQLEDDKLGCWNTTAQTYYCDNIRFSWMVYCNPATQVPAGAIPYRDRACRDNGYWHPVPAPPPTHWPPKGEPYPFYPPKRDTQHREEAVSPNGKLDDDDDDDGEEDFGQED